VSRANVETVERAIAALNARDIDAFLACCTEAVVVRPPTVEIFGEYEGAEGIKRFWADVEDAAPDFRLVVEKLESVGADHVIAFLRVTASGRASGVQVSENAPSADVYDLVDGKISRIRAFFDRREALKALGLEADSTQS
jgi:ketosteroid isomerase-like protein